MQPSVLVVGAGPTGLVLALDLSRRGVSVRIVDQKSGPTTESRAIAVQARTLELYDTLGLSGAVLEGSVPVANVRLRYGADEIARASLAGIGAGLSPFPDVVCYPQDRHERMLVDALAARGVTVEWGTQVTGLREIASDPGGGVEVELAHQRATFDYVCGCDGAHSVVRKAAHISFEGSAYSHRFYVADAEVADVEERDVYFAADTGELALLFPLQSGRKRVIGMVPDKLEDQTELPFDLLRPYIEWTIGTQIGTVHWYSTYKVHHRVAARFREGRMFLLGDAGHVHSPVGGQGMNTGIGDALNLSWKLAHVLSGRANVRLLDTYEPERIAFARTLVATTDRIFQQVIGDGTTNKIFRSVLLPRMVRLVDSSPRIRRALFRRLGQLEVSYRKQLLGEGRAGKVHGGDRLPFTGSNFEPLRSGEWQLHIYGAASHAMLEAASALSLPLHELPWDAHAEDAGLAENATYLVRPDGYVGLALPDGDPARLRAFLEQLGLLHQR